MLSTYFSLLEDLKVTTLGGICIFLKKKMREKTEVRRREEEREGEKRERKKKKL